MSVWVLEELAVEEVIRMWLELWLTPPILEQTRVALNGRLSPVCLSVTVSYFYTVCYMAFSPRAHKRPSLYDTAKFKTGQPDMLNLESMHI